MATDQKKKDLRIESIPSLQAHLLDLDREIFALRNELALHRKLEKPHLIKQKRREKARTLTILTLKQRALAVGKEA